MNISKASAPSLHAGTQRVATFQFCEVVDECLIGTCPPRLRASSPHPLIPGKTGPALAFPSIALHTPAVPPPPSSETPRPPPCTRWLADSAPALMRDYNLKGLHLQTCPECSRGLGSRLFFGGVVCTFSRETDLGVPLQVVLLCTQNSVLKFKFSSQISALFNEVLPIFTESFSFIFFLSVFNCCNSFTTGWPIYWLCRKKLNWRRLLDQRPLLLSVTPCLQPKVTNGISWLSGCIQGTLYIRTFRSSCTNPHVLAGHGEALSDDVSYPAQSNGGKEREDEAGSLCSLQRTGLLNRLVHEQLITVLNCFHW